MPKHIIEFDMPADKDALVCMLNAQSYRAALEDIAQKIRTMRTHTDHTFHDYVKCIDEIVSIVCVKGVLD